MHAYLIYLKMLMAKIQNATKLTDWAKISVKVVHCPICGPTFLIKLNDNEIAIRCLRCGASIITMSLVKILKDLVPDIHTKCCYELSSRGPLFTFLKNNARSLTYSEYFEDVAPGEFKNGVQCQDVQALTFPDDRFDVCTSTEVFEHVANDRSGFSEIYRVLKRGGIFIFTVPMDMSKNSVERVKISNGEIEYLLPPEYHDDSIRGFRKVLCFRNYGKDIVDRLIHQGFSHAEIYETEHRSWFGYGRPVIAAYKY